jgi:hypothetical protein
MDSSKPESAVFEQAKQPLMAQGLEREDKKEVDIIEPTVEVNKEESWKRDNLNTDNKSEFATVNTNNGGDALSNANVPIKNDFNETLKSSTESSSSTTQGGKSLFAKAKDTLSYLKDTAMQMTSDLLKKTYKYSDPNKAPIVGMGKLQFEAMKLTLEKNLHLQGMKTKEWREEKRNEQWKNEEKLNEEFNDQGSFETQQQQFEQQPQTQFQEQPQQQFDSTFTPNQDTFQQSAVTVDQPLGAVQGSYQEVNKEEFVKAPDALFQQTLVNDDRSDELQYLKQDKNEVHVLPSIKVQDKPVIIEKEVLYEKPVEIKQTIVHQEKPIIIEQPIIKQKFEHYRDNTEFSSNQEKVITENNLNNNLNTENEALLNLRKNRIDAFNDTTPIYQTQKENIKLDTEYREQPTVVNEKQVIYQQPVEIEQKFVEKIKPVVHENVTLQKEHVYEKQAPTLYTDNVQQFQQGDQFFSKDAGVGVTTNTNTNMDTNMMTNNNNDTTLQSNLDARNDANFIAGQEQRTL